MTEPLTQGNEAYPDGPPPLSVISGRITLEQSDQGVSDLVIEALDVAGNASSKRVGSVSTDGIGVFRIEVPPPKPNRVGRRNQRTTRNLQLVVLAPERDGLDRDKRSLFRSEVREHAGSREHFRIELSAKALKAAGIELESPDKAAANAITAAHVRAEQIQKAIDGVFESKIETVAARRTLFRTSVIERLTKELSEVSDKERASDRFVPADNDIERIHLEAVKTDVIALTEKDSDQNTGEPVNRFRLKSRLLLTEDQRNRLTDGSAQPVTLSEEDVEEKLAVTLDKPAAIYRLHLEPDPCRPTNDAERCLDDIVDERDGSEDEGGDTGGTDSDGNRGGGNVTFDKEKAIATVMGRQTAPEHPVEFGAEELDPDRVSLELPLTAGGVSDAISQVIFAPGPADVPAFYDFHDLQIAFEPVWQEALDDKFLEDVESVYDRIVERGGVPAVGRMTGVVNEIAGFGFIDSFFDGLSDVGTAADDEVPAPVASTVLISLEEWRALPGNSQLHLSKLASLIETLRTKLRDALEPDESSDTESLGFDIGDWVRAVNTKETIAFRTQIRLLTSDAERIVAHARLLLLEREANEPFKPTHTVIKQLRHRRHQAYPFRHFAASAKYRSVNFGIMVTYRQLWTPVSYQVGELVSTIPLAPKEVRKFTKKTVIRTKRIQKEIESNLISRKRESEEKSRAEAEIVARATAKTNFSLSREGTINIGEEAIGGSTTITSTFSRQAEKHSQSVKKEFREAILKSAEEYKNERKIEISTEESFDEEITESGEIQNPNDEIPVTYLFYELQRRFNVAEKIHRLQSVVLVAQEVPRPSAIDKAWLIRHDWILNRVLLDDSFRPALTYVSTSLVSEDVALREMRQALFGQRKLVEELKEDVEDRRVLAGLRYGALQRQIERTAKSTDSGGGLFGGLGDLVSGIPIAGDIVQGGLDLLTGGGDSEAAQIREGAARDAFDRERREEQEFASRLQNALSTLQVMQRSYTERLAEHLRQLAQCERLLTHIAQNILYYMQAIWAYEPDDQRFLRLRNVPVPVFEKDKALRTYEIHPDVMKAFSGILTPAGRFHDVVVDLGVKPPPTNAEEINTKPLSEVADLDRPLGFKGNYMIFPMLEANPITEFMMDPYVTVAEGEYGVSDPDPLGNMTLEEFSEYVCCLKNHFDKQKEEPSGGDDVDSEADPFEEMKPVLRETLKRLLELSLRNDEEVVVPCDCLYIEALPGAHSVMEKFKHLHRQIDVKQAQSELRESELDNIRRAQRIVDDQLEDPDIEKKIVIEGDGKNVIVPPGDE